MNDTQKRFALFLPLCIGSRALLAYLAYKLDPKYLPWMAVIALIIAVGFIRIYFFAPRNTGPEVFGGKIWWNDYRLVHAINYLAFAVLAFQKKSYSWVPLAIDVVLGLVLFLVYHGKQGDFKQLL